MRLEDIRALWREVPHPILYRAGRGEPLRLRLSKPLEKPQVRSAYEYQFLLQPKKRHPQWDSQKRHWEVPHAWLDALVKNIVNHFGYLYLVQPFQSQQVCARSCQEAIHFECECSCMGVYHGSNGMNSGWYEISEHFAVSWSKTELACRLMKRL